MTPSALDGIAHFGRGWRYTLVLGVRHGPMGQPEDDLKVGDAEAVAHDIARRLKAWIEATPALSEIERYKFTEHAEELAEIEDDLDEVRHALNRLYDDCDYFRVCVQ